MHVTRFSLVIWVCLMLAGCLYSTPNCFAEEHKKSKKFFEKHEPGRQGRETGRHMGDGRDKGNETTGQIAAWSLAAANLTVALSLMIKGVKRFAPLRPELMDSIVRFNSLQKKHLIRFHYLLNPLILVIAILHWILSRCRSTTLPEWALLTMCAVAALGVILKFKLCPKSLLRNVYRVHTQPVLFLFLIFVLVVGHLAVD